jgi:hypothetical protein
MKKSLYLLVLGLSAFIFSCKKDDDKPTPTQEPTAQELILGKWNFITSTDNDHYGNVDHRDTATYQAGSATREFLKNGMVVDKFSNFVDSMAYKFEESKLLISSNAARTKFDTFTVKSISATDMQLYSKEVESNGDYYEWTDTFKK